LGNNNDNTVLARKLLGIVTEHQQSNNPGDGLDRDGFDELWQEIRRAAAPATDNSADSGNTGNHDDDSLIAGLAENLDAYLDSGGTGSTSGGSILRISNKTMAEARHWLVRRQRRELRTHQSNSNGNSAGGAIRHGTTESPIEG
jgi:hypothetical protein